MDTSIGMLKPAGCSFAFDVEDGEFFFAFVFTYSNHFYYVAFNENMSPLEDTGDDIDFGRKLFYFYF